MSLPRLLHPFTRPTREQHLTIVRGEGALVWDRDGKEYVDAMSSLWFANVGYGRREVVEAIAAQASTLHTYHLFDPFTVEPADHLAERLAALAPVDDARVFLCSSGSEAIDTALKLARAAHVQAGAPERSLVVSRSAGYHGTNYGGTSSQGIEVNRKGFGPLLESHVVVPHDDIEAMATLFATRGHEIAAVLTEPVQGAGGVLVPPEGYLPALRRLCDDHGTFLIADEVICGFGRLGSWFGVERFDVRPDLITFAKGVTSGYVPLGGVIVGDRVRAGLEADPDWVLRTGYTYSGHATACAAALACIDVIESDGLLAEATRLGARLQDGLSSMVEDGRYAGVRGMGFLYALTMKDGQTPATLRDRLLDLGVIARPLADSLAFCPPLVITDEQLARVLDAVNEVA